MELVQLKSVDLEKKLQMGKVGIPSLHNPVVPCCVCIHWQLVIQYIDQGLHVETNNQENLAKGNRTVLILLEFPHCKLS